MFQLAELLAVAAVILVAVFGGAFLVSRLFHSTKTRKRIIMGAAVVYLVAFVGYFGFIAFIMSGNLN